MTSVSLYLVSSLSLADKWLSTLFRIRVISGSILGPKTCNFPQSLRMNTATLY